MNPTFISPEASVSGASTAAAPVPGAFPPVTPQQPGSAGASPAPRRFQSLRRFCRRLYYLLRAFVPLPHRGGACNSYLTSVETLMELENTGTILIDHRRPGVVVAMEYLTLWNRAYAYYGDDRILHAWCDKFRAVINLRRGIRSTSPPVFSTVPDASPSVTHQQPGSASPEASASGASPATSASGASPAASAADGSAIGTTPPQPGSAAPEASVSGATVPVASASGSQRPTANSQSLTPVLPETPLHIVVVEPDDYTKPWAIGLETATTITLQKVEDTALNPYLQ